MAFSITFAADLALLPLIGFSGALGEHRFRGEYRRSKCGGGQTRSKKHRLLYSAGVHGCKDAIVRTVPFSLTPCMIPIKKDLTPG